jgi:chorismate lyase/3-hydroxybenzoate synthase
MTIASAEHIRQSEHAPPLRPHPPAWVDSLVPPAGDTVERTAGAWTMAWRARRGTEFTLISAALPHAPSGKASELAEAVAAVYGAIADTLGNEGRQPVRVWNFVPDIQGAIDGAGDRYMAFNEGRFAAYCRWFGGPEQFRSRVPTASAVGIDGHTVWVHILAADAAGEPVENPRQTPAYGYSARYGRRPPCFARATRVGALLFVGGTASILGETSRHDGDLAQQIRETLQNLSALIGAAAADPVRPLARLRSVRAHVRRPGDAAALRAMLAGALPDACEIELVYAPLCRKELLIEIEGVAAC